MSATKENQFETELCEHLAANGWLYSPNGKGYDKDLALYPEDVLGWLQDTQPDELAKIVKPDLDGAAKSKAERELLQRLAAVLDEKDLRRGGTLHVLRKGFKHRTAKLDMSQAKPPTTNNPATTERYEKVRVRVVRQVYYSRQKTDSIDLVLFVNGIPVATLELKTDFTQELDAAVTQYKTDRDPKNEPLLTYGRGALVHFAVSNLEVQMTTRLAGQHTVFLPFNRGNNGRAGNPTGGDSSPTSYLWERVLQRDSWLDIVHRLVLHETKIEKDPYDGKDRKVDRIVFPRFHQWEAVGELLAATRAEGAGGKYLIEHSAGSGKTNTISWTAHGLATMHDENNDPLFSSVILVTDRTVLDSQLQRAVGQVDRVSGFIGSVNDTEIRNAGETSKSGLLAKWLIGGKRIIVVTIQTFPFVLDTIQQHAGLADKRFAIIADEAHSSQTGTAASELKKVLTAQEAADLDDGGEIDAETILAAEMANRADSGTLSYYAFTATPKAKTLELFGRAPADGEPPVAFHQYTMQQAIEEGFILDVLKGYSTYKTYLTIVRALDKSALSDGATLLEKVRAAQQQIAAETGDENLVDENAATKGLMRWVQLHPTNISQKVQIIVEHFRSNVEKLLDGQAKAMVVTSSRKAAVRYKKALDAYIAEQGYAEVTALVAFSGEVEDTIDGADTGPLIKHTETTENPGVSNLAAAFDTPEYRVMIVANKFQTGFDQPRLVAMYVDKQLSGITAVQTLSRLNRTFPGKTRTFVLDFQNTEQDMLDAFLPYYQGATLERTTDPNLINDLQTKLDAAGWYTEEEIDDAVAAYLSGNNNKLAAAVSLAAERIKAARNTAARINVTSTLDEIDAFRKDARSYVNLYDFLSQVVNLERTDLEKTAIFLRVLNRLLESMERAGSQFTINWASIDLDDVRHEHESTSDTGLDHEEPDSDDVLRPPTGVGTGGRYDPQMVAIDEVIRHINALFADANATPTQQRSWVEALVDLLMDDPTLVAQAKANSEEQFLESKDMRQAGIIAIYESSEAQNELTGIVQGDDVAMDRLLNAIGKMLYLRVHPPGGGSS